MQHISRQNNFDFLRLVFASSVIISHSFPLTKSPEIFAVWSRNQFDLGELSVNVFFVISGYLIFMSLQRSKSVGDYLWKRIIRLYAAVIVLLILTVVILPFVYTGPNIFSQSSYWNYFPSALSLYGIYYNIPGIFENNAYPRAVNGSLWTLSYEFTMYLVIASLFMIRHRKASFYILLVAFMSTYLAGIFRPLLLSKVLDLVHLSSVQLYRLASYFIAGALLFFLDLKRYNTLACRSLLALILTSSIPFHIFRFVAPVVVPLLVIFIGSLQTKHISAIGTTIGDISYGIYIYGFLIQQLIMNYFDLGAYALMAISLPLTALPAYLSWHLVEKKALRLKRQAI